MEIAQLMEKINPGNYQSLITTVRKEEYSKDYKELGTYNINKKKKYRETISRRTSLPEFGLNKLVPQKGFFKDYVTYVQTKIYSTTAYHILIAIHFISLIISKKLGLNKRKIYI